MRSPPWRRGIVAQGPRSSPRAAERTGSGVSHDGVQLRHLRLLHSRRCRSSLMRSGVIVVMVVVAMMVSMVVLVAVGVVSMRWRVRRVVPTAAIATPNARTRSDASCRVIVVVVTATGAATRCCHGRRSI